MEPAGEAVPYEPVIHGGGAGLRVADSPGNPAKDLPFAGQDKRRSPRGRVVPHERVVPVAGLEVKPGRDLPGVQVTVVAMTVAEPTERGERRRLSTVGRH